jgi:hypothetical protein
MNRRAFLSSRFFLVPAAAIVALICWNIYVGAHAHGVVTGRVLRSDGTPAAGATIVFYERNITSRFLERARATADETGSFRFDGNRSHQVRLDAIGPDSQHAEPRILRLWFAAQDVRIREPLVLPAPRPMPKS